MSYFDTLLTTKDFGLAIDDINKPNSRIPYALFAAELIFDTIAHRMLELHNDRRTGREWACLINSESKKLPTIASQYANEEITIFFKNFIGHYPITIQRMKNYFLMETNEHPLAYLGING